ncbi:ABC transporter permease [Corynebacterium neomassiliense]|uniref:ABC transporter permease n=1 Tax=Corynebacterium neomassiliense TaxID=2079482 RepID=UPI001F2B8234|nr:ABC transporter permease [Corynebacterium neomassiliense]
MSPTSTAAVQGTSTVSGRSAVPRVSPLNPLRAEITKLFSVRSSAVYAILLTGSLYGPVTLVALLSEGSPDLDWSTLLTGLPIFQLIAVIFASSGTAGDIRNHMHAQAFLTQHGRWQWVIAKVTVTAVFTAVTYAVGTALAVGIGGVLGGHLVLGTGVHMVTVGLVTSVLFAAMCVGLACILRGQVASVAVPVAWMLVIDGMLGMAAGSIDLFRPLAAVAPVQRMNQLMGGSDPLDLGLSTAVCYLVIVGWFVVLTGAGLWRDRRTDVR